MSTRTSSITPVRPQENATAWLIKIATGPLLVILLIVHLTVNHMTGSANGLMNYEDVVNYFNNPWIVAMEITFLACVVTHSLLGLRGVILDLHPSAKTMGVINLLMWVLGVGSVLYGIWLALTIASFSV
jgi:succinate dehydrogenase / fumarate reductase, membrane anchor subunit